MTFNPRFPPERVLVEYEPIETVTFDLFAPPPPPSPSVVQKGFVSLGAAPQTITLANPVTAGNLLVCAIAVDAGATRTVSDDQADSWVEAIDANNSSVGNVALWWTKALNTSTTVVTLTSGGSNVAGQLYEVAHVASATPVDQTASNIITSSGPVVGPDFTGLVAANDFCIYWAIYNPPGNAPVGGIWTSDYSALISGQHFYGAAYADTGPNVTGPVINPGTNSTGAVAAAAFHQ